MTASTLAEDRERRVSNRPWILEKSFPLYLGDRVDILLAGDDEPSLPLTFFAELFADGLQIEHEVGIVADILADLIDQKDDMMIFSFFLNVRLYALGEVFIADGILPRRLFTPVAAAASLIKPIEESASTTVS